MKLTKKLETEILKVYNTYWESYSNGDIKTFAGMLDKTFELIGTSESEICHTKEDGIKFLKAQVKELGGKVEMRNRKISVVPVNELMLVNERCNIYILSSQDWRFYSKIRISTFLRKTTTGWKVFHQHGSFPDMQVQEGETLAVKKINKENLQLRDAIKRRTIELEEKNRELEIETALEKVRTVAMGMKRREDMLQICKTISQQLAKLGVKEIRNVQTAIFNVPQGTYMNYEYYAKHNKTFVTETVYTNHKIARAFAAKMLKGGGEVSITYIKGEQKVKEWLNYQKGTNVFIDAFLNKATSLTYYWYSLGPVALGISTYFPLTKEEQQLFSRFLKVFELAYRRYLDIEKAEAQAREAKIEAALEKIRAQAMAMHKSEELLNVCEVMYKELKALGFHEIRNAMIHTFNDKNDFFLDYDYSGSSGKKISKIPVRGIVFVENYLKEITKGNDAILEMVLKGKELQHWKDIRKATGQLEDKRIDTANALYYYYYSTSKGDVGISTFSPVSKEKMQVIERFRNVFQLSYQRYLDIEKAEAQAREALIEASLEKVRAQALGMRKPEELTNICEVLFKELKHLGFTELRNSMINIHDDEMKTFVNYDYSDEIGKSITPLYYDIHPVIKKQIKQIRSADDAFSETVFKGRDLASWKAFRKIRGEKEDKRIKNSTALYYYFYSIGTGSIGISTFDAINEEERELLKRFRNVFAFAYRRYMDVATAEAQAREAQIEAALERVRAASMSMRDSSALSEIIYKVYVELTKLDAKLDRCFIMIVHPESKGITWWMAGQEGLLAENGFFVQMNQHASHLMYLDYCKQRKKKWTYLFEGKEKRDWDRYGFSKTGLARLPEPVKAFMSAAKKVYLSGSSDQFGSLVTGSFEPLPQEQQEIISRFTIAFNQAYIRFLDLKKAEAQAREAQIQLALERVRSRTIAMHKSDELLEVTSILYGQLKLLGLSLWNCGIMRFSKDSYWAEIWMSRPDGKMMPDSFRIPMDKVPVYKKMYEAWKKKKPYHTEALQGKEVAMHSRAIAELNIIPVDKMRNDARLALPDEMIFHVFNFAEGCLGIIATCEIREPELLERFGSTFRQAYIRFLDLQKAEAQAREAQIEAALERVRSRSLAMHKSEELKEVIRMVLEQFIQLNIKAEHAGFYIDYKAHDDMHIWLADPNLEPFYAVIPYFDTPTWNSFLEAKTKGITLHTDLLDFKTKNKFYRSLFKLFAIPEEAKEFYLQCKGLAVSTVLLDSVGLYIENFDGTPYTDEENNILVRFGKVFQQAYTRFLDLQKAEAQAREAQIEAALERVRSRTMAMQKSEDMNQTASEMFKQIQSLGMQLWACGFNIFDKDEKAVTQYMSLADGGISPPFRTPLTEDPFFISIYDARQRKDELLVMESSGESLAATYRYMFGLPGSKEIFGNLENSGFEMPKFQITHCAYFSQGYLVFITYEQVPEAHDIFKRFAKVFEQTYTRFLDLQKAEAQAREAEIQLALERVRAKSLAMHHTSELQEVVNIAAQQLHGIGMDINGGVFIVINTEVDKQLSIWASGGMADYIQKVIVPELNKPIFTTLRDAIKRGNSFLIESFSDKEKREMFSHLFKYEPWKSLPQERKDELLSRKGGFARSVVISHYTSISITNHNGKTFSEEENEILKRFGKVFEQSYIRFLDLQRAEAQAWESQVQLSLERVRAKTMAMQKQEDLFAVVNAFGEQLVALGLKVDYVSFINGIILKDRDWDLWGCNPNLKLPAENNLIPYKKTAYFTKTAESIERYERTGNLIQVKSFTKKEKDDFFDHYFSHAAPVPEEFKKYLYDSPGSIIADAFLTEVTVSICRYDLEPYTEEQLDIFKRFSNEFRQAYIRFLDLQKAEAQAREAQIEVALERVRSRSMAMHRSEELADLSLELVKQVQALGVATWFCAFNIYDNDPQGSLEWGSNGQGTFPRYRTPREGIFLTYYEAGQRGETLFINEIGEKECPAHYEYLCSLPGVGDQLLKMKAAGIPFPASQIDHVAFFKYGYLLFISYEPVPESHDIFIRFAKVFEQTYTRFLDLQKAEAQARESQIQLALERVRARTMAMQNSNELLEAGEILCNEMNRLGISSLTSGYVLIDEQENIGWNYTPNPGTGKIMPQAVGISHTETTEMKKVLECWKAGEPFSIIEMDEEETIRHQTFIAERSINFPISASDLLAISPPRVVLHNFNFKEGYILIVGGEKLTTEQQEIMIRFTKVFQQTYTRFLDLQKAEAQAKEAKVEAALERVRSQAMAMRQSADLLDIVVTMRNEFTRLGHEAHYFWYMRWLPDKYEKAMTSGDGTRIGMIMELPRHMHGEIPLLSKWEKSDEPAIVYAMDVEAAINYVDKMVALGDFKLVDHNAPTHDDIRHINGLTFIMARTMHGEIGYSLPGVVSHPPADDIKTLVRFAGVFDLAYRRFEDLKLAEQKNRETEIELALEKVRSRTMAMHKSEELGDVATVLFKELNVLVKNLWTCGFVLCEKNRSEDEWWISTESGFIPAFYLPNTGDVTHENIYQGWLNGEVYHTEKLEGEALQLHYDWLMAIPVAKKIFDEMSAAGYKKPEWQKLHCAYFSKGYLRIITREHCVEEEIFKRFASVFDLTYTRFLDLKKAEAQAREGEIELALERVRARTMAMQHSNELPEAATILFQQMQTLGMPAWSAGYCIWNDDKTAVTLWMSSEGVLQPPFTAPTTEDELFIEMRKGQEQGKTFHVVQMGGDKLAKHYKYMRTLPVVGEILDSIINAGHPLPTFQIMHHTYFSNGFLLFITYEPVPESHDIFKRFGKVFDQTYTRFLDLQKAEAQAKEAQIETALEKVRSRTMAMQSSNELQETAAVLFQEFKKLGTEEIYQVTIGIYDEEEKLIDFRVTDWAGSGQQEQRTFRLDMNEPSLLQPAVAAWKKGKKSAVFDLTGERLQGWLDYRNKISGITMRSQDTSGRRVISVAYFSKGHLSLSSPLPLAEETIKTLERFANVFDGTYTRFLDLEKAEAQAKEARIEAALERIRSKSLAMHHSSELSTVVDTLLQEFTKLEFSLTFCIINLINGDDLSNTVWAANPETGKDAESYYMKFEDYDFHRAMWNAWKAQDKRFVYTLEGEEKRIYDEYLYSQTEFRRFPKHVQDANKALERYVAGFTFFKYSGLQTVSVNEITEAELEILERFGRVFEQAYTRFLDLQKAEAQAREAQIQLALERARAQSMMMQHSKELDDTLRVFHEQVLQLGIRSAFSFLWLPDEENDRHIFWAIWAENNSTVFKSKAINYPLDRNEPATAQCLVDWKSKQVVSYQVHPEGVETYFGSWSELIEGAEHLKPEYFKEGLYYVEAFIRYGCFGVLVKDDLAEDEKKTLYRFAIEFERTYTRFLDLQKAEAQAREAQVETALEKVRSKAMAMHSSEDLAITVDSFFAELRTLRVFPRRCGVTLINKDSRIADLTVTTATQDGETKKMTGQLLLDGHPVLDGVFTNWKLQQEFHPVLQGSEIKEYYKVMNPQVSFPDFATDEIQYGHYFFFKEGGVFAWTDKELAEETLKIFRKFTSVLSLTYRRYIDLMEAEAQTKEAQIEAALERVRSKAMAMHNTQDLADTIGVFYKELTLFSMTPRRCGVGLLNKENKEGELFTWNTTDQGESLELVGKIKMEGHPVLENVYNGWVSQTDYYPVLRGNEIKEYYKVIRPMMAFPDYDYDTVQYGYFFFFKEGGVYAWTEKEMKEDEVQIYRRFTSVLSLTYKRYKDLQQAEANAREAQIEVALERVRARALAMQEPEELKEVAQVMRNEMGALGVEELETSSIYIYGDNSENVECWYALQDPKQAAKKMIADYFMLDLDETWVGREMKTFYLSDEKQTSVIMQGANRREWIDYCYKHSPVFSGFYGETIPDRTYHLYKFSHGYIGAAAPGEISVESWRLLSRAASVFSLAYSRFKDLTQARIDLQRLKEEKQRAEAALTDLQATQKQLVQSEKMASLGELTAGIAHEIQNPLNFVNNFSEVSTELIREMVDEVEKGNVEEVKAIASDLIGNLEKINHHGKRADGIVKGMLQHSRSSTGQKELTDINALCDEYLRLAYHGLRAKDKSFNAKFETHFDETVGKLNVIPQDIGRVVLNLINNAFYAVSERKKLNEPGYEPTVSVSTFKDGDTIRIKVRDNGTGIPQKVLDKIFQPFFTTKPTGQGTGLGLSLSYDIVTKGHGGELKVETKEAEGTEFSILLPV